MESQVSHLKENDDGGLGSLLGGDAEQRVNGSRAITRTLSRVDAQLVGVAEEAVRVLARVPQIRPPWDRVVKPDPDLHIATSILSVLR